MSNIDKICVFCSSSDFVDSIYKETAEEIGRRFSEKSITLVYGGAKVGMMGIVAKTMVELNADVIGVIPELIHNNNLSELSVKELIITKDMKSRKAKMHDLSDAFIALPGGFGTLEELLEIITLKQLEYHSKAIVILNINGFYDKLKELFEELYNSNFASSRYRKLYYFADSIDDAMSYIENYIPCKLENKWTK